MKIHNHVYVFENKLPLYVIEKYNISPDTYKCNHPDCKRHSEKIPIIVEVGDRRYRDSIQNVNIWFCRKRKGLFPSFIEENNPSNEFARLLTDPSKNTNWFSKYVSQAYHTKLKKEFSLLASEPEVLMADQDLLITSSPEKFKDKPYTGKIILEDASFMPLDEKSCILEKNGKVYPIGLRMFSSLWPESLEDLVEKTVSELMGGKDPKKCARDLNREIRSLKPEELIMEFVLSKDPDEYSTQNRIETKAKKAAGYAKRRLHGGDGTGYISCIATREHYIPYEWREYAGESRIRLSDDPKTDLERVDKKFYAVDLLGNLVKKLTGASQENLWAGTLQQKIDSQDFLVPEPKPKMKRKSSKKIIRGQSSLNGWL